MDAWICPKCWHPEELHLHLGRDPTTGAAQVVCLFDHLDQPLDDRYYLFHELARDAYRLALGASVQYVPRTEYARVLSELEELRQGGLGRLQALAQDVSAMEADLERSCGEDAQRIEALQNENAALLDDDAMRARIRRLVHDHKRQEDDPVQAAALRERLQALEAECADLRATAERHDAVLLLNRGLEGVNRALEERVAELEASRTDYGTCGTCGVKASQGVVSEIGTFGACGNAAHMKAALAAYSLKSSKSRPSPAKKAGTAA